MSAANGSAVQGDISEAKGKGKEIDQTPVREVNMEQDDSSEEESAAEEPQDEEDEEEDNMDEIDTANIVGGRTRGKNINWAEADQKAKDAGVDLDDEDDEDDEDFEGEDHKDHDAMEE